MVNKLKPTLGNPLGFCFDLANSVIKKGNLLVTFKFDGLRRSNIS